MKGKYYVFTAGTAVPKWMFAADFTNMTRRDLLHNKKHGRITFRRSCIVVRGDSTTHSKIMPMDNSYGEDCVILISRFISANVGRVNGASGVFIPGDGCKIHNTRIAELERTSATN